MSEVPNPTAFSEAGLAPLKLSGAIARAREEIATLTQMPIDAVTRTERGPDGGWVIAIDLIEAAARLGDNDLIATYELEFDASGETIRMERTARYKREESL